MSNYPVQSQQQLNAQQLVQMVRDRLQIFSPEVLRDGFSTDPLDDDGNQITSTPILFYINEAQRWLQRTTRYSPCRMTMNIGPPTIAAGAPSVSEYLLSQGLGTIIDCMINGKVLERTYLQRLDLLHPGWADATNQQPGIPTHYYTNGDLTGFYPVPDQAYTAYLLGTTQTSDLVDPLQVPSRIPNLVMPLLADWAALQLNEMVEVENQMAPARVATLTQSIFGAGPPAYVGGMLGELLIMVNGRGEDDTSRIAVWDYRNTFLPYGGYQGSPPGWGNG